MQSPHLSQQLFRVTPANAVGVREPPAPTGTRAPLGRLTIRTACLLLDLLVLSAAYWLADLIHFEGLRLTDLPSVLLGWPLVVALQYAMLAWLRVPRFSWTFIGLREVLPIAGALSAAALLLLAFRFASDLLSGVAPGLQYLSVPASVIVLDAALAFLGTSGIRILRRLQYQRSRRRKGAHRPHLAATPAILIGAGRGGRQLAEELAQMPHLGLRPVAFVDDDPAKVGAVIDGIQVAGTIADLPEVARRHQARQALIAIARPDAATMHRILEQCGLAGLRSKIIPHLWELVSGRFPISQVRDVAIEDLLGRAPVDIPMAAAASVVTDKVVLVTGAGGSIGSELCRQIVQLGPRALVLVEQAENNLYQIHREITGLAQWIRVHPELADVCDAPRMQQVFEQHRPDTVFHAAAHKHVPMSERNPGEVVKNNVFGTKVVADLAVGCRCGRFILVSTDKAVNPTSVMGATKRLAELYVQDLARRTGARMAAVRFGNVAGSAGSVIPLFREQIAKGGPVTVTHPEMERYFMTIPEASRLVLEAAALCRGGEVMLLDMGKPVRIRSLAEQMIRLSGLEPGVDIEIEYTGIRPGEKLREELTLADEVLEPTECSKVFLWRAPVPSGCMQEVLDLLASPGRTPPEVRRTLRRALPEYRGADPGGSDQAQPGTIVEAHNGHAAVHHRLNP